MSDWRFEVDEVGDDGPADDADAVEAGTPSLENALFVALGALTTLAVLAIALLG